MHAAAGPGRVSPTGSVVPGSEGRFRVAHAHAPTRPQDIGGAARLPCGEGPGAAAAGAGLNAEPDRDRVHV